MKPAGSLDRLPHDGVPGRLVGGGDRRDLVGPGRWPIWPTRPSRARARASPGRPRRGRHGGPEQVALRPEVVEQVLEQVGHEGSLRARSRMSAHWSRIRPRRGRRRRSCRRGRGRARGRGWPARTAPGRDLVRAEQVDGEAVHLAPDPQLQRTDGGEQGRVGAGGDPQLEGGGEDRRGSGRRASGARPRSAAASVGRPRPRRPLGAAHLGQVLDRGHDQVVLGREVVQPGHPG